MNAIQKHVPADDMKEWRKLLQNFMKIVNKEPDQAEIKVNQHANNTRYLPISYVEMALDELYFGLWETKNFEWKVVGNEIAGSITLRVFHPSANVWIERTGTAATMIRQQKGAGITEVEKKIHNALEMDFPHLKADCLANAARSLGKLFGRDLNRKFYDIYKPLIQEQAVANGAITASVDNGRVRTQAINKAHAYLEQARMEDHIENSFIVRLSDESLSVSDIYAISAEIMKYLPESSDPAVQNRERAKNPAYK
jgi:hypothetical protein